MAVATHIAPAALLAEDDHMVATLYAILSDQAEEARKARRK